MNDITKDAKTCTMKKQPLKHKNPAVDAYRNQRDPKKKYKIESAMALAAAIEDAMIAKGLNRSRFAQVMGVLPSQITRWLSGTQGINTESIFDMEFELNTKFILNHTNKPLEEEYKPQIFEIHQIPLSNEVTIKTKSPVIAIAKNKNHIPDCKIKITIQEHKRKVLTPISTPTHKYSVSKY